MRKVDMKWLQLLLAGVFAVPGGLLAQDEPKPLPPRQVRFLALGDLPPFRQEIRGGVRYELEPPPGSIPPRELVVGDDEKEAGAIRLTLGRMSSGLEMPGGAGPLFLRRKDDAGDAQPWVRLERPEAGDFIVLLWRDPASKSWNAARSLAVPTASPAGSATFLNVTTGMVAVAIGTENFALAPGKPVRRTLAPGTPVAFQIGLADGKGGVTRKLSRSLEQVADERTLVFIYRSDGEGARSPVGVKVHREKVTDSP